MKLARKKFYPVADNHSFQFQSQPTITRADFEGLLGHCQAVTDAPASVFAAELIAAYPEAKVVLNMRRDEEKWQESLVKTIIKANESWGFWVASWLDRECFWAWHVYERFLWPALFRCVGGYGELGSVVREGGGRWVWRGEFCLLSLFVFLDEDGGRSTGCHLARFCLGCLPLSTYCSTQDNERLLTLDHPDRTLQHDPRIGPSFQTAGVVH